MVLIHKRLQQADGLRASRVEQKAPRKGSTPQRNDLGSRENVLLAYLKGEGLAAARILVAGWVK